MDEELKKLLQENLEISKKNFELLKKMRRLVAWQMFFHWAKWTIIAILLVAGYFQIQLYLEFFTRVFQDWDIILKSLGDIIKK